MSAPVAAMLESERVGQWKYYVRYQNRWLDITKVRGAPVEHESMSETDPFGYGECTISIKSITAVEPIGVGELAWFMPERDLNIVWAHSLADGSDYREDIVWEGFLGSPEWALIGVTVLCVGALRQVDNYLAKPEYLLRPLTYEYAIERQLRRRVDSRWRPLRVDWPVDWPNSFNSKDFVGEQPYMLPVGGDGLVDGAPWTGLLTRETGRWEPALSSYVQGLLTGMQSAEGPWTLMMEPGRQPVLRVRRVPASDDPTIPVIDVLSPGVSGLRFRWDHTQKGNVIFGQGRSISGSAYSGVRMSVVGGQAITSHEPYAALRQVHPAEVSNPWLNDEVMRKEVSIPFSEGLTEKEAAGVSALQLQRVGDPGLTGSLTLMEDLLVDGVIMPRQLVRAGISIRMRNLLGEVDGIVAHVVEVSRDAQGNPTLTWDTKYRDQLTVQEMRKRGRDAMRVPRLLTVGSFEPNVPDLIFPWSYEGGSGYLPASSATLWQGPTTQPRKYEAIGFPWTDLTRDRPPKSPAWENCYAKIGPVDYEDASSNWATRAVGDFHRGYPMILGAAGNIRLIQVAAFDEDGNVLPVRFHVGLYYSNTVDPTHMPKIPAIPADYIADLNRAKSDQLRGTTFNYKPGQPYPFFHNAFNTGYNPDGTKVISTNQVSTAAQMIVAYGNGYEQAGFWPGNQDAGDAPSGMFSDESGFSFDFMENVPNRFPGGGYRHLTPGEATADIVTAYVMIYCDDHGDEPVYFLGRAYRDEPGSKA